MISGSGPQAASAKNMAANKNHLEEGCIVCSWNCELPQVFSHGILKTEIAARLHLIAADGELGHVGLVDVGLVATKLATSPAVKPGDALVSLQLIDGPARTVSAAEGNLVRARNLELTETDGAWKLSWDYTNPGDTNQDGMVTVNDLTPIGMHYGETVDNSWDDPLRHIDADHNCEINLGDITPLGQN